MAAAYNRVVLMGNLTRDPRMKEINGGTAVTEMGMAINEKRKTKNGEDKETTCFVDLIAWDRLAETCGKYLQKGSPVLVEGHLQFDQWESREGERKTRLRVRAEKVQFLSSYNKKDED